MFRRCAAASTVMVSVSTTAGSNSPIPRRSRSSRTLATVHDFPSAVLLRIRFRVTANSRSGQCPPSLRMTSTGLGDGRRDIARFGFGQRELRYGGRLANESRARSDWHHLQGPPRFLIEDTRETLLCSRIGARSVPGGWQVPNQCHQRLSINCGPVQSLSLDVVESLLQSMYS